MMRIGLGVEVGATRTKSMNRGREAASGMRMMTIGRRSLADELSTTMTNRVREAASGVMTTTLGRVGQGSESDVKADLRLTVASRPDS